MSPRMSRYAVDLVAPLDALLLKGDGNPTSRAIMSCALILDQSPSIDRLRAAFESASHAVPRMRQRIARQAWTGRPTLWLADDHFSVTDHVRMVGAPGDCSLASVLAMAGDMATIPFDPARPLWDATLVTGVDGGEAVLLLRVHHAIADGVRALHMLGCLLDLERDPAPSVEKLAQPARPTRASFRFLHSAAQRAADRQSRYQARTRIVRASTLHPFATMRTAVRYGPSTVRTYAGRGATASPLLRNRSRARLFRVGEFGLTDVKALAMSRGVTVNDVFLAIVVGALHRYHLAMGLPATDVPLTFPMDIANGGRHASGNHFSAAVIPAPCSEPDPVVRLRRIHDLVIERRSE